MNMPRFRLILSFLTVFLPCAGFGATFSTVLSVGPNIPFAEDYMLGYTGDLILGLGNDYGEFIAGAGFVQMEGRTYSGPGYRCKAHDSHHFRALVGGNIHLFSDFYVGLRTGANFEFGDEVGLSGEVAFLKRMVSENSGFFFNMSGSLLWSIHTNLISSNTKNLPSARILFGIGYRTKDRNSGEREEILGPEYGR